jgi:hypothetical protein
MSELDEKKVREGAKKIITLARKFGKLLDEMEHLTNELNARIPISPENFSRAAEIIIEEIDKSDLHPLQKELIKATVMSAFLKTPTYIR